MSDKEAHNAAVVNNQHSNEVCDTVAVDDGTVYQQGRYFHRYWKIRTKC